MTKHDHITKVIFRKFNTGEVIALFPELPGDLNPCNCQSYMQIGQHGAASTEIVVETTPATPEEYSTLARELSNVIGYNLQVVKHLTYAAFQERRKLVG